MHTNGVAVESASFAERVKQYVEWGKVQGGKLNRPWNKKHARMRADHLEIWRRALSAQTLDDITLEAVERQRGLSGVKSAGAGEMETESLGGRRITRNSLHL